MPIYAPGEASSYPLASMGESTGDPKFGARLRKAREALKLTEKQLGEKIRKDQSTIAGYELGTHMVEPKVLAPLSAAVRTNLYYLLTGETESFSDGAVLRIVEGLAVSLPRRIWWKLGKLSPEGQAQIVKEVADFIDVRLQSSRTRHRPRR